MLSAGHLLEAPQGLDVVVEAADPVHWIEHHHVCTKPAPPICRGRPALRIRSIHAQPSLDAKLGVVAAE